MTELELDDTGMRWLADVINEEWAKYLAEGGPESDSPVWEAFGVGVIVGVFAKTRLSAEVDAKRAHTYQG